MSHIKGNVSVDAKAIYTDDGQFYGTAPGCIKNHNHQKVHHKIKEWVRGDVHTGTIDGYWGLLKRGVIGSYHQISVKHLNRYLSEFQFKWNHRKAQDIFALVTSGSDSHSPTRSRTFLLHKNRIGALLTDNALYRSGLSGWEKVQANRLAADILMPRKLVNEHAHIYGPDARSLSQLFGVSESAMRIRLGMQPIEVEAIPGV